MLPQGVPTGERRLRVGLFGVRLDALLYAQVLLAIDASAIDTSVGARSAAASYDATDVADSAVRAPDAAAVDSSGHAWLLSEATRRNSLPLDAIGAGESTLRRLGLSSGEPVLTGLLRLRGLWLLQPSLLTDSFDSCSEVA